jgi:nitroreductase
MELMDAIRHRRSVRAFTDAAVPKEVLLGLVDAATLAPSANNAEHWHFTIIQNQALLDRISDASKAHMLKVTDLASAGSRVREHLTAGSDFHVFYHAPAVILISTLNGDFAIEDAALAAENLMLAAHGQGLGTCWIGFAQKWLETAEGKRAVELDPHYIPVAPIIVGMPKGETPPVPRKTPAVHWID